MTRTVLTRRPRAPWPTSQLWWALAGALLVVGVGCLALGLRAPLTLSTLSTPDPARPPSPAEETALVTMKPGVSRSAPVALAIPAIDVDVSVSRLGLHPNGTVEVPADPEEPGWFHLGPSPGQAGSAVILGHVDSYDGPAIFYRLRELHVGDKVAVRLANGVTASFTVTKVATYLNEEFPARRVYGSHGGSSLKLVTCGGEFDTVSDSYQSNFVVFTSLLGTRAAARGEPPDRNAEAL